MASAIAGRDRLERSRGDRGDHRRDPRHDGDLLPVQPSPIHPSEKAGAAMKSITIDPITRLEGHGKIHLFLNDDGGLANAYFQVPELRGFEVFCRNRPGRGDGSDHDPDLRRLPRGAPHGLGQGGRRGLRRHAAAGGAQAAGTDVQRLLRRRPHDALLRPRRARFRRRPGRAEGRAQHPRRGGQGRASNSAPR